MLKRNELNTTNEYPTVDYLAKYYPTRDEVKIIVEDSADSVMRSCAVQFSAIDERFDRIESTMATKTDLNDLYKIMVNRFDALESKMDRRFDEQDKKFEAGERRFHSFELFMKGHEKRITKVEKRLVFA